jgi:PTH1 family peptidyl-tRNA hydrolase
VRYIVGLGNPGERYRRTRHNVGFEVVDALASRSGTKHGGEIAEAWLAPALVADEQVLLVKPLTFMNRTGLALASLLAQHGGTPAEVVAIVDDVALELGRIRVRARGTHGGHNGLRSMIEVLGTEEFARVRVGIRKGEMTGDLAEYVLDSFPREDAKVVEEVVSRAADAVECILREGAEAAMNRFNGPPPACDTSGGRTET